MEGRCEQDGVFRQILCANNGAQRALELLRLVARHLKSELAKDGREKMVDTRWFDLISSDPRPEDGSFLRVVALQCALCYRHEELLRRDTHPDNIFVIACIEKELFEMLNRHHITVQPTTTTTLPRKKSGGGGGKSKSTHEKPEWAKSITDRHRAEEALLIYMRQKLHTLEQHYDAPHNANFRDVE